MSWKKWKDVLLEEMQGFMSQSPDPSPVHGRGHILRVWNRASRIGRDTGADMETLVAAVMLHDLARHHGHEIHGKMSAEMARPILERTGFPEEKREDVFFAISVHDTGTPMEKRTSLESKVLADADLMDAMGAVGVMRYIIKYLHRERGQWTWDQILELVDRRWDLLSLPESRERARSENKYLRDYIMRLRKDIGDNL